MIKFFRKPAIVSISNSYQIVESMAGLLPPEVRTVAFLLQAQGLVLLLETDGRWVLS